MKGRVRIYIICEDVREIEEHSPDALFLLAERAEGGDGCECVRQKIGLINAAAGDVIKKLRIPLVLAEVEGVAEGNDFCLVCVGGSKQAYLCGRGTCRTARRAVWRWVVEMWSLHSWRVIDSLEVRRMIDSLHAQMTIDSLQTYPQSHCQHSQPHESMEASPETQTPPRSTWMKPPIHAASNEFPPP